MLSLKSTLGKSEEVDTTAVACIEDRVISSCVAICCERSTGSSNGTDADDAWPGDNCTDEDSDEILAGSVSCCSRICSCTGGIGEGSRPGRMGGDTVSDS